MNENYRSDEQLVRLFIESGEMTYMDELLARYVGPIRNMVYTMVQHDADADDVTQEVFVRTARAISNFKFKASFSTWLYRIAMNTTKQFLNKRNKSPLQLDEGLEECHCDTEYQQPDQKLMNGAMSRDVGDALASLTPNFRAAITLIVMEGMSPRAAAKVEGVPVATMYWRVHQARAKLKIDLKEYVES